jgi:hypothetical protein
VALQEDQQVLTQALQEQEQELVASAQLYLVEIAQLALAVQLAQAQAQAQAQELPELVQVQELPELAWAINPLTYLQFCHQVQLDQRVLLLQLLV